MRQLDYRLLGPLEVVADGESLALGRRQQRAVLAILLLQAQRTVSSDQLIELIWSDKQPGKPQTAIQGYVSALRKLLGRQAIETSGGGYLLRAEPERLDLYRFERFGEEGRQALARERPEQAARLLESALALWRGPALADFTYEAWAQAEIGRLEELRLVTREELIEARLALAQHAELVGELEALIQEQPLRERTRSQLMLALYRSGQQAEALDVYQRAREQLRKDLGIDPSPELQSLYKQILNQDDALAVEPAAATPPNNLPAPPNRLIGRERELEEVEALLRREDVRLVTLTGPGGAGKTRLAQQAATNLLHSFRDGVFWVGLAALRDSALVAETIAQILGAKDGLIEHIAEHELLLLLDNLEQVVEAAPELSSLVAACPNLTLLVTSRELLRVQGELEYSVPPLAGEEAVSLFCERARLDESEEIAEVCRRLDNLPLAVELAATRAKALSPAQILERLSRRLDLFMGGRDADPRQQTLRGTLEWSYDLLSEDEQELFRRLAVFAGACTLEAAEKVCRADLDTLQSLVEKSLLRFSDERYWMLETIREYALGRLTESGELEELHGRHAEFFRALAGEVQPQLMGSEQAPTLERLAAEIDNFRTALTWLDAREETDAALLAVSLGFFWYMRGHLSEGRSWLERSMGRAGLSSELRLKLVENAAFLALRQRDFDRARECVEEGVILMGERPDAHQLARLLHMRGDIASGEGDLELARSALEEALANYRELGDIRQKANVISDLADLELTAQRWTEAEQYAAEALSALEGLEENPYDLAVAGFNLALARIHLGRADEAVPRLSEVAQLCLRLTMREGLALCLQAFAALAVEGGSPDAAARMLGSAEAAMEATGGSLGPAESVLHARTLDRLRAELDGQELRTRWTEGRAIAPEQALIAAMGEWSLEASPGEEGAPGAAA